MIKRIFQLLVLILAPCLGQTASAQGRDDGSLYSRYGVGELHTFSSSRAQALGGNGTALYSYDYLNFGNPAAWSRQSLVRIATGMQFDRIRAQDASGSSERLLRGAFNALQIGVPLLSQRLGLGLSFEPYSRVDYQVTAAASLSVTGADPLTYEVHHEGSGGLRQIRAGLGWRHVPWLSVGVSVDYLFGITETSKRTTFDSVDLVETTLSTSTRMHGTTATGGIVLSTGPPSSEFTFAASGTLPARITGRRTRTLGESLDRDTLGVQARGTIELPASLRSGIAFKWQSRWLIAADVRFESWTNSSSTLPLRGFVRGHLRDRLRIGGGVEWIPAGANLLESYFSRVAYRLGIYRDNHYVSPVVGTDIDVTAITGGIGLPTLFAGTRLDLVFEVGTRGTTEQNLVRDRFIAISATLNVGERWFLKRRLR